MDRILNRLGKVIAFMRKNLFYFFVITLLLGMIVGTAVSEFVAYLLKDCAVVANSAQTDSMASNQSLQLQITLEDFTCDCGVPWYAYLYKMAVDIIPLGTLLAVGKWLWGRFFTQAETAQVKHIKDDTKFLAILLKSKEDYYACRALLEQIGDHELQLQLINTKFIKGDSPQIETGQMSWEIDDEGSTTCLHFAAGQGHVNIIELFIDRIIDIYSAVSAVVRLQALRDFVNHKDLSNDSALDWAIRNNHRRCVIPLCLGTERFQQLVKEIEKITIEDDVPSFSGRTLTDGAFSAAIRHGDTDCFKILLDNAKDKPREFFLNAMLEAAEYDLAENCRLLIENGVSPNELTENGESAITVAAKSGSLEALKVLIANGGDATFTDQYKRTLLMLVAAQRPSRISIRREDRIRTEYRVIRCCSLLIEHGADAHAVDKSGNTALMEAAASGRTQLCQMLLNKKVEIDAKNRNGESALIEAALRGRLETVNFLLQEGAVTDGALDKLTRPRMYIENYNAIRKAIEAKEPVTV